MKKWLWIFSLIGALVLGMILAQWWYRPAKVHSSITQEALLQKVQKVFKLVTVEGSFLEIYDYQDFYYYDWAPFRKKALVKVQSEVSLGYDLDQLHIEIDEQERIVMIRNIPGPTILSMDVRPSFYDLQEGAFNSFGPKDHNKLMKDIRAMVERDVWESRLSQQAQEQMHEMLSLLSDLLRNQGWSVQWDHMTKHSRNDLWALFPR